MFCKATLGEDAEGGFVFWGAGEVVVSAWQGSQEIDFFGFCCGVCGLSQSVSLLPVVNKTELISVRKAAVGCWVRVAGKAWAVCRHGVTS